MEIYNLKNKPRIESTMSENSCCVCFETTTKKVCKSSHLVCESCLKELKTKTCPVCRQELKINPEEMKKIQKNIEREQRMEILREKMRFVKNALTEIVFKYKIDKDSIPDSIMVPLHYNESETFTHIFECVKRFALDENFPLKKMDTTIIAVHDSENFIREHFM